MNSFWLIVVIICQTGLDLFIWIVIEYYTVTIGYFMFHLYCLSFKIVVCYSVCSKHLFYRFTLVPVLIRIVILDTVPSVLIYFIVVGDISYHCFAVLYVYSDLLCCSLFLEYCAFLLSTFISSVTFILSICFFSTNCDLSYCSLI